MQKNTILQVLNDSSTQKHFCDSNTYILCIPSYTTLKHQLYASAIDPFLLNHSAFLIYNTINYRASTLVYSLLLFTNILYNLFNIFSIQFYIYYLVNLSIKFSISSTLFIISLDKLITPSFVTNISSSILIPIPSSWIYIPGSTVNTTPGSNIISL